MDPFQEKDVLEFDGVSEYISFGDLKDFPFSDQITIEAWIRPEMQKNDVGTLFSKEIDGLDLIIKNGKLILDRSEKMQSTAEVVSGEWHHLAVSYNATLPEDNIKLYLDGILDSAFTQKGLVLTNENDLLVGKEGGSNNHLFKGDLAYFVIWKSERQLWQIRQDKSLQIVEKEPDLILLISPWKIEKNTLYDTSGNEINGQLLQLGPDKSTPLQKKELVTLSRQSHPIPSPLLKSIDPLETGAKQEDVKENSFPVAPFTKKNGEIAKLINKINTHNAQIVAQKRQELNASVQQKRDEFNQKNQEAHQEASEMMRLSNIDSIFFSIKGSPAVATPLNARSFPWKDKNLIAQYPLHEDACDKSGNGLHGRATDQVQFIREEKGRCAVFETSGANIQLPSFKESYDQFTFSCWLKADFDASSKNINWCNLFNGISINRYYGKNYWLYLKVGLYYLQDGAAIQWQVMNEIQEDAAGWKHIVLTFDKSENQVNCSFYLNGEYVNKENQKLRFERPYNTALYLPGPLSIGGGFDRTLKDQIHWTAINSSWEPRTYKDSYDQLHGSVKDAYFFDRKLTDDEIKTLYQFGSDCAEGPYIVHDLNINHLFINDFAADLGNQQVLVAVSGFPNGIYSIDLKTGECKQEVKTTRAPSALDFDDDNRSVYWIEASQIWCYKYDGSKKEMILDLDETSLGFPNHIKIDAKASVLFWSSPSGIWRSDLDGTSPECLLYKIEAPLPVGLTLDKKNHRLFWIDSDLKQIRSSDYSGKKIIDLYSVQSPLGGFDFTPDPSQKPDQQQNFLYWNEKVVETNQEGHSIISSKLFYAKADGSSQAIGSTTLPSDARFIINTKAQESLLQNAKAYDDLKNETLAASKKIEDAHMNSQNEVDFKHNELIKAQEKSTQDIAQKNEEHRQTKIDNQKLLNQTMLSKQKKILDAKSTANQNIQSATAKANQINSDAQTQAKSITDKAKDNYRSAKNGAARQST